MLFMMILYWQSVDARAVVEARVSVRVGVVPSRRGSVDAAAQRSTSTFNGNTAYRAMVSLIKQNLIDSVFLFRSLLYSAM